MKKAMKPPGRWRRANNYDPYKRLAAAVVNKAAQDYYKLARQLTSPYLDEDKAASMEVEANNIEAWLLDPLNEMVNSVGLDVEMIEEFIDHASSEDTEGTAFKLHKN
jgi:hypothetical protein